MKITRGKIALLVLLLAAVGMAAFFLFRRVEGPKVDAASATIGPLVETMVTSGRVIQRRQSDLGALVQSTVAEVTVDSGDRVEADALLVRLVDDDARARLDEAEANVAEAEARVQRVQNLGRRIAAQSLREARQSATYAQTEFERQQRLFEARATTEAAFEQARRQRDAARGQRIAATLESAASAPEGSDTAQAAASLARAQAGLRAAEVALNRTQVRAPSAGVVLVRHTEPGEVVGPGEVLITFAGDGPLEVQIQPDESNLRRLAVGQRALISPEAFPDRRLAAEVSAIAPSIDRARGTVAVELSLEDDADLRPDMTVSVEVVVGSADRALVLPVEYVRDLGTEDPWVLVVESGAAARRSVEIGLQGDDLLQITSGIDESDTVLSASLAIEEGDPVRVRRVVPALSE